ncbi:MAG: hypothetical protein WA915_14605 [Candidatus Aminicenantaceae bacterium]
MSDIREDLAFTNCFSRVVDGIDPEDCVSTANPKGADINNTEEDQA